MVDVLHSHTLSGWEMALAAILGAPSAIPVTLAAVSMGTVDPTPHAALSVVRQLEESDVHSRSTIFGRVVPFDITELRVLSVMGCSPDMLRLI